MIRSPFNFVPLSEKVFFPDWADNISHDVPFADGVSGTIDIDITACSPIFIRNGHTRTDHAAENEEYKSFSYIKGADGRKCYYIPATSIKGEVRNLLEIMSFSKMSVDRRAMFARRDLHDKPNYPLLGNQNSIRCGWLRRSGEAYTISDCGTPMRISLEEIDNYVGDDVLTSKFMDSGNFDLNKEVRVGDNLYMDPKSAAYKYHLLKDVPLEGLRFSEIKKSTIGQSILRYDSEGSIKGTIVMTGQPSKRKKQAKAIGAGKFYEFVFPEEEKGNYAVSEEMFNHFSFIYKDSSEWKRIDKLLNDDDAVPVFFRIEKGEVKDFGMAYLYKLPYERSVFNALPEAHQSEDLDLAQCIFGFVDNDHKRYNSLKGRVQFGNAFAVHAEEDNDVELILGGPKASYLPFYIRQDGKNGTLSGDYATYDKGTPSGWKRYHVRDGVWQKTATESTDTKFRPLKQGAQFRGTVSFHNLRPVELGALLAALTFFNTPECFHQLGMAKPYGYGRCRYDVRLHAVALADVFSEKPSETPCDATYYMALFEQCMKKALNTSDWRQLLQIRELFAMAASPVSGPQYEYMEMGMEGGTRKSNEFNEAKKKGNRQYLPLATERGLETPRIQSLVELNREKFEEMRRIHRQHELETLEASLKREIEDAANDIEKLKGILEEARQKMASEAIEEDERTVWTQCCNLGNEKLTALLSVAADTSRNAATADCIMEFIPKATSPKQLQNLIKKWLKKCQDAEGRNELTADEAAYLQKKLQEVYQGAKSKDRKNFASNRKNFADVVGEELTEKWFSEYK